MMISSNKLHNAIKMRLLVAVILISVCFTGKEGIYQASTTEHVNQRKYGGGLTETGDRKCIPFMDCGFSIDKCPPFCQRKGCNGAQSRCAGYTLCCCTGCSRGNDS
ncbi:uncharacterized protein LOC134721445 isoform X2 [Mytilus trossulus]|uniref:uncharacterized protein LOC134721445 isoform X2 n=1 Tax=Mytilus trossulus TaxID=6551 RepID=UPI003004DF98